MNLVTHEPRNDALFANQPAVRQQLLCKHRSTIQDALNSKRLPLKLLSLPI